MKKLLKRIFPVMMALSMMFSMSVTALAADDTTLTQDTAIAEDALVLTEDTVITEDTDVMVVVSAPGIKVTVEGAKLSVGIVVAPDAAGAEVSVSGTASLGNVLLLAEKSVVVVAETAAVTTVTVAAPSAAADVAGQSSAIIVAENATGAVVTVSETGNVAAVTVAAPGATAEVKGAAGDVKVAETATGAAVSVAENAKVAALTVDAADVKAEVKGSVESVELTEKASGFKLDADANAAVGAVTAPESVKESMEVTGAGADKVPEAETTAPTEPSTPSTAPTTPSTPSEPDDPNIPDEPSTPVQPDPPVTDEHEDALEVTKVEAAKNTAGFPTLTVSYTVDTKTGVVTDYYVEWWVTYVDSTQEAPGRIEYCHGSAGLVDDEYSEELTMGTNTFTFFLAGEEKDTSYGEYIIHMEFLKNTTDSEGNPTNDTIVKVEKSVKYMDDTKDGALDMVDVPQEPDENENPGGDTGDKDTSDQPGGDTGDKDTSDQPGGDTGDKDTSDQPGGDNVDNGNSDNTSNENQGGNDNPDNIPTT